MCCRYAPGVLVQLNDLVAKELTLLFSQLIKKKAGNGFPWYVSFTLKWNYPFHSLVSMILTGEVCVGCNVTSSAFFVCHSTWCVFCVLLLLTSACCFLQSIQADVNTVRRAATHLWRCQEDRCQRKKGSIGVFSILVSLSPTPFLILRIYLQWALALFRRGGQPLSFRQGIQFGPDLLSRSSWHMGWGEQSLTIVLKIMRRIGTTGRWIKTRVSVPIFLGDGEGDAGSTTPDQFDWFCVFCLGVKV